MAARRNVNRTVLALALLSVFGMLPALGYWHLATAPGWARAVLLVSLLQLAYAAWLATVPDWRSLWATMFVWAVVATLYAVVASLSFMTPVEYELPLGLSAVRRFAPFWCSAMTAISAGAAYFCGHTAQAWKRGKY